MRRVDVGWNREGGLSSAGRNAGDEDGASLASLVQTNGDSARRWVRPRNSNGLTCYRVEIAGRNIDVVLLVLGKAKRRQKSEEECEETHVVEVLQ